MNRICDSPVFQRDAWEEKSVMLLDVVFQDKTIDKDMPLPRIEWIINLEVKYVH